MNILFIGQRGIPTLQHNTSTQRERRIEALAGYLAQKGHRVLVVCAKPFVSQSIRKFNGAELIHRFSLDPHSPGGFVHLLRCLPTLWKLQPDVVHMHGWKAAALVRLMVAVSPNTSYVWTVDTMPSMPVFLSRLVVWQAQFVLDAITTPTRTLQYLLLIRLGLRAEYVPDGYDLSTLPDISLRQLGVRKGQYVLTTAASPDDIRWIAKAYKASGSRKKLVVPHEETAGLRRLKRTYPFLHYAGSQRGRLLSTFLKNAHAIIVAGTNTQHDVVLQAMESGHPIIAQAYPLYEELLGTAASFVHEGDSTGLRDAFKLVKAGRQRSRNTQAQRRARAHFAWARIAAEYLALYRAPYAQLIPLDSAKQPSFTQLPAR